MQRLILVDGHAVIHRAFHALPPLTTRNGELVNAVYGFAGMIFKILDDLHPEYIAVAFDTPKPNFRHREFVGYQAQRPKTDSELVGQIEKVHQLVSAFNIPIFEIEGFEADDVIGTLARQATNLNNELRIMNKGKKEKKDHNSKFLPAGRQGKIQNSNIEVIIVTGDRDLMQLVNKKVKLYMPTRGLSEGQIVGEKEVEEKMGVGPELIVDYKGLVGDASDNYPGVPGIGPKTAIELLKKYKNLKNVYANIGQIENLSLADKLKEGKESALLSQKLALVVDNAPVKLDLEACRAADFDKEKLAEFFRQLGFRSMMKRISGEEETIKVKKKKSESQQSLF